MNGDDKQRAKGSLFRAQARELQEIARTVKLFGLPGPTTERAVARIRPIASSGSSAPFRRFFPASKSYAGDQGATCRQCRGGKVMRQQRHMRHLRQ